MKRLSPKGSMNDRIDTVLYKFRSRMRSYPPGLCPISLYRSLLQISMNQSCGKCIPCRDGLVEVDRMLQSIMAGSADESILEKLTSMCQMIAKTSDCAVGISAAQLILDSLEQFADEYEIHVKENHCISDVKQTIPCVTKCPAHVNVPGYIALIKEEDYAGAVRLIKDKNPFPTACAYICEHPCEKRCRRAIIDDPINIRGLKKYAVDMVSADEVANPEKNVSTGKKVAVIGAGPSGMTAAYYLGLMGHAVTVYDVHDEPGGMLRYGIPEYRLPKEQLDKDIRSIMSAGDITFKGNVKVGKDIDFDDIRKGVDAVYLAIGADIGNRVPVDGADAGNVIPAADFLQLVSKGEIGDLAGKRVALIGGGNVAMDAARTAVRLNAKTVHVFTRKRDDFTAVQEEIVDAMQEGVRFRTLLSFLNIETSKETDEVSAIWLQPEIVAEYDEYGMMTTEHSSNYPYRFECDYLILAVGQRSDVADFEKAGVPTERSRVLANEECFVKDMEGVFSGGDCVTGPSTAINAIAAGQVAAYNIDEYLGYHHKVNTKVDIPVALPNPCKPTGRAVIQKKDPCDRKEGFEYVELPLTYEEAIRESSRCLRCDHHGCGVLKGGRGDE